MWSYLINTCTSCVLCSVILLWTHSQLGCDHDKNTAFVNNLPNKFLSLWIYRRSTHRTFTRRVYRFCQKSISFSVRIQSLPSAPTALVGGGSLTCSPRSVVSEVHNDQHTSLIELHQLRHRVYVCARVCACSNISDADVWRVCFCRRLCCWIFVRPSATVGNLVMPCVCIKLHGTYIRLY